MNHKPFSLLAISLLIAGCGPESQLEVDLRGVAITVPRLATPAVEVVPAAPVPPPVALPELPPLVLLPAAPRTEAAAPALPTDPVAPPAPVACPKAGQFDVPDVPGTPLVESPPAPGQYVQTASGTFTAPATEGSLDGSVAVTVTSLPPSTSAVGQKVEAWQVQRTDAAGGTSVERYQLVHPADSPLATEPGIYLVGLAWKDSIRGELVFEPVGNGLHVLPNPVVQSTSDPQYVGSATDPATLTTLSLTRNVTGTKRVDLCGELVDTYTVAMEGTLTTPQRQYELGWTQQLATAYRGANVEEVLSLSSADGAVTWSRGLRSTRLPKAVA